MSKGRITLDFSWEELERMNTAQFNTTAFQATKAMMAVAAARCERLELPTSKTNIATMSADLVLKLFEAGEEVGITGKKKEG